MSSTDDFEWFRGFIQLKPSEIRQLYVLIVPFKRNFPGLKRQELISLANIESGLNLGSAIIFYRNLSTGQISLDKLAALVFVLYRMFEKYCRYHPRKGKEYSGKALWEIIPQLPNLDDLQWSSAPQGVVASYITFHEGMASPLGSRSNKIKEDDRAGRFADQLEKNPALVFRSLAGSGFEFQNLAEAARQDLFVCGQNLFSVCAGETSERNWKLIRKALDRGVKVRLMLCDLDYGEHIPVWSLATSQDYGPDLVGCTRTLQRWQREDSRVEIRVTKFVPMSAGFIDPDDSNNALAAITLHHYQKMNMDRPLFIVSGRFQEDVIGAFYRHFQYVWNTKADTRSVLKVNLDNR